MYMTDVLLSCELRGSLYLFYTSLIHRKNYPFKVIDRKVIRYELSVLL